MGENLIEIFAYLFLVHFSRIVVQVAVAQEKSISYVSVPLMNLPRSSVIHEDTEDGLSLDNCT